MAVNALEAGYEVRVFDLRDEAVKDLTKLGASPAGSPKEAASDADFISIVVVDDEQVERVMHGSSGVFAGACPGAIVAIHSTVLPETVVKLAKLAAEKSVDLVDAPVSGGEAGARAKKLCYMVGGDSEVIERSRRFFSTSAADVIHMGALGSGAAAKAIAQVVTCINMLAAHEAESLGEKLGLNLSALSEALHKSSGQSFVSDHWLDRFKLADDPMAIRRRRTEVFQKSLTPAIEIARALDLSLSGAALAQRLMPHIMGIVDKGSRQ